MDGQPYEHVYEVRLLDDLHNYFPELLYNPLRFDTVPQVLSYVHSQISSRFNLFQYGRRRYFQTRAESVQARAPTSFTQDRTLSPLDRLVSLFAFGGSSGFENLFSIRTSNSQEDVVVRPTDEQIQMSTRLVQGSELLTEQQPQQVCAICQDSILSLDPCRLLQVCGHSFHQLCIDQWFQRNVRCPVCRHDIRSHTNTPATPREFRRTEEHARFRTSVLPQNPSPRSPPPP
jgi:hypothetical protein